ncbi:hypothetical protein SESBI_17377 [Sesbania bispinosa]|nr:hypothetical protein SESBI_17377 [Sesbania bispinosa]
MNQYLIEQGDKGPAIVILQLCKLKVFKGTKGISNAFNETKLLINPNFKEDLQYKEKLQHADEPLSQVVSYSSGQGVMSFREDILSIERMTFLDVIDCSRECFVAVLATIIEIDYHNGWFYEAFRKCKKKVTSVGKKYSCQKCEGMITKIDCFKLQVYVIDSTGSAQFTLFNQPISNLMGKSASELINPTTKDKEFLFKVSVSEYNIEQSWQGYPVSNMTDDAELIEEFKNLHSVKGNNKEDGLEMRADFMTEVDDNMKNHLSQQQDANSVQILVEKVDGSPSSKTPNETISKTPSIKIPKKRMVESVDITEDNIDLGTQTSSTKLPKLATIKKEPDN